MRARVAEKNKIEASVTFFNDEESRTNFFVILPIPANKNSELMFCFLFLLRVLNASFSYVFLRKIIIFAIS